MTQPTMSRPPAAALELYTPALRGRIPSLDGLRALSIGMVLLGHAALGDGAPRLLRPFGHAGNIGVRFFFIISGFLITTLLLKEWRGSGGISLRNFYLRRVVRIFPAAYVLIGVIWLLGRTGVIHLGPGEVLYAATFSMNYHDFHLVWLGQLWSLAVEEQFYFLWPGLLLLAGPRRAVHIAWGAVLLAPALRFCMWHFWHASDTAMTKHFEAVADALAMGCLMSLYFNRLGASRRYSRLQSHTVLFLGVAAAAILLGNLLFLVRPGAFYVWGQTLANLGTVLVIDWAVRHATHPLGRLLQWKPMVLVGVLSYSLYLWQNPFLLGSNGRVWTSWPLNLPLAVLAALLSYWLIEKPCLERKDWLVHRFNPRLR